MGKLEDTCENTWPICQTDSFQTLTQNFDKIWNPIDSLSKQMKMEWSPALAC